MSAVNFEDMDEDDLAMDDCDSCGEHAMLVAHMDQMLCSECVDASAFFE